jgi:hypothetical protein
MAGKPTWDPQASDSAEMEDWTIQFRGQVVSHPPTARGQMVINSLSASRQVTLIEVTDDENFGMLLESISCVSSILSKIGVATLKSLPRIDHITFSTKWGVSKEKAKWAIQITSQHGVRTILHPSLSRQFRTDHRILR